MYAHYSVSSSPVGDTFELNHPNVEFRPETLPAQPDESYEFIGLDGTLLHVHFHQDPSKAIPGDMMLAMKLVDPNVREKFQPTWIVWACSSERK